MNLRRHPILITLLATATLASAASAQQRVTIGKLMSSPFPTGLVAAPNHGKIAWVQNAEGRRNIWVATAPDYRGQQITQYTEDDGQEVTNLQFGPGANHILYVRGGAPNRQQEIPNPTSDPDGTERAIWIIEAAGGEPRKLAEGSSPVISPDGENVTFIKEGQIWSVPSVAEGEPEQLTHTRGNASSLRWSPDGSMLAFASSRGDHSFIGVYNLKDHTVRYLDPSVYGDGSPAWSPDNRHIAFIRVPNERQRLPFAPRRTALPWSIRVVDVATGQGRTVLTTERGNGSAFRGVVAANQLFWGAEGHLVFPWELDGWTHLYSIPAGGGRGQLLTPGEFEVEHVSLSPDRRDNGIEWSPVMTGDGGAVAFLASDAREPAHAEIIVGSENRRALASQSRPRDFPTDALVEPQQVIFSGADGMSIHGQLFLPGNMGGGERYPAVLFFHGGSRRQMLLGWHYGGYYHNAYALNQYLASQGYIVLSVNYRSGIGYGMEFREALNYGARGASEFNDVLGAGLYLQSRADVDPQRIGLWGGSYGGYLTALGLARASDLFAAGVDVHGVHDWNIVIRNFVPSYNAAAREEFSRLAFESSPMAYIESWRSPVLLIHGDDDRNVPFSESVHLAESLARQGVEFEQLIFPDEVHGFLLHRNWIAAYEAAADFFERKLKGREVRASER
jgi:dipeptidyl aminopeptidase/acylaminoacyl peptidase